MSDSQNVTETGLKENVASLLTYVFGFITGIIFFVIEKNNKVVRFHAMQSILVSAALAVLMIALSIVSFILGLVLFFMLPVVITLFTIINAVVGLGSLAIFILCIVKAYQGGVYKLPIIGEYAAKFSGLDA